MDNRQRPDTGNARYGIQNNTSRQNIPPEKRYPPRANSRTTNNVPYSPAPSMPGRNTDRKAAPNQQKPRPVPPAKPSPKKRNFILFLVLTILIVAIVIISAVQSGSDTENSDYSPDKKNTVRLNSETTAESNNNKPASVFAQYTDNTAALDIESDYGILIDLDTNTVIASKKGDEKIYPASMTKIMTLIVAVENAENLDDTFTFTAEMLDPLYAQNASQAGFAPGEAVTIRDMMYGCILPSGADATVGLANYIAGGEKEFASMMNDKAKELGLTHTHFVTVSGLHDDGHYSTCHEMAIILRYAISDPFMREILSKYQYTTAPTKQHPDGILLTGTLYSRMVGDEAGEIFVQGGKTGYTVEGRNCLATFAAKCSEKMSPVTRPEYILVTASALGEHTPVRDAIKVYRWLGEQ